MRQLSILVVAACLGCGSVGGGGSSNALGGSPSSVVPGTYTGSAFQGDTRIAQAIYESYGGSIRFGWGANPPSERTPEVRGTQDSAGTFHGVLGIRTVEPRPDSSIPPVMIPTVIFTPDSPQVDVTATISGNAQTVAINATFSDSRPGMKITGTKVDLSGFQ